ncbi:YncE family protein [Mycobacterium sp. 852014-52144_SCH5372336]|uniref:YncE family protein n=1 Tax=Mycobacterium sp. 852014-52144_SCH5372336 TaxID=1834115 RepID=UPI0007FE5885|nr:YncE family protein [Mycobacterium sp. 852014-52144_SCH5372336]OBB75606.1 hypothetical protein A5759_06890 [Mycobacterium sp. 852014-52144_SCH5372336]
MTEALASALLGSGPDAPAESPLSWVVLAAARRFSAEADADAAVQPAAQMATVQTLNSVTSAPVTAAAVVNQPPIIEEPAFGTPDPRTGATAGQIVAKDPEGKKLSYALTSGPSEGKLVFDKRTGAFTYTPTASQRVVAGLTPDTDYAQFTVSVSDGAKANIQTVTVNVAINPAPLVDAGSVPTGGSTDAIAVTNTRAYVANTAAKTITVIDTINRTTVATIQLDQQPVSLEVTADGKRVYVVDDTTNLIHVIDATNNTMLAPIDFGPNRYPLSVAVSPDGKTLLATGALYDAKTDTWTPVVTKVATATGKVSGTVKLPGSSDVFYDVEFSADGKKVYVVSDLASDDPENVTSAVYTFATSATTAKLVTTGTYITDVAINPAGTRVYVNDADAGTIRVFDASNKLVGTISVTPETMGTLTLSRDGGLLFSLDTTTNSVVVFDTATNAQIASLPTGATTVGYYPGLVLSPDGREFYYASDTGLRVITVLPVTNVSTPGAPVGNVIIGAFGTRYQVMTDVDPTTLQPNGSTRVSILDADGRVITTTQDIAGTASGALPIKRADGSLLVATYDAVTNTTTVTAVSTSGVATPVGSLTGAASRQIFIASNGAAFLQTDVDATGSAHQLIRISKTNVSQTYIIDGSTPTSGPPVKLAPDGSAYVVYKDGAGMVSVLAIDPNGDSTTTPVGTGLPTGSLAPVTISSDGKAYVTVSSVTATKILTFTGTAYTEREVTGQQVGSAVVGAKGAVYLVTADGNPHAFVTKLTATTLRTSVINGGFPVGQPAVASDGTTYVLLNWPGPQSYLGIVSAAGKTKTVPINGNFAQAIDNLGGAALTVGFDKKAYVAYVDSDGRYHVAIVTPTGGTTIKDMPVGTTVKHSVYFTIRGVAAQPVQTIDQATGAISTSAIVLSSGARTEEIPGELVAGAIDFKGNGYLVTSAENAAGERETTVLAFTSAAKTIAKITAPGEIVLAVDNLAGPFGARPVVLTLDGTAYVTISAGLDNPSGGAEIWAIKGKSKTKVMDFDTALVTAVTVQQSDSTAYVTVSEIDEATGQYVSTVRALPKPVF